jgi:invasion protein IalB
MTSRLQRTLAVAVLAVSLFAGAVAAPSSASPSGQAANLSKLKADWSKMSAQKRKGTCATYNKYPSSTLVQSTNRAWAKAANHKNMTIAEWLKVYKAFFRWAC